MRDADGEYIMPEWSKYRGRPISDVKRSYLEWLQGEWEGIENHPELDEAITEELETRDRSHVIW